MSHDKFDRLLDALPRIAESVNSFNSTEVQAAAFAALVHAMGVPEAGPAAEAEDTVTVEEVEETPGESDGDGAASSNGRRSNTTRTKTTTKKTFTVPKGLNFAPQGKSSLEQVIAQKKPKNQLEKNLIAVYYLQEVMEEAPIDTGKVLAVWRAAGWDAPPQPDVVLRNTAVKGWIDTSDMGNIRLVWRGENYFENKLPRESKTV